MRFFRWHFLLILFWVIFEVSFLQIVFPNGKAPLAILALVVTMGIVFSLDRAFGLTLLTVLLFDLSRAGTLTTFFFFTLPLVLITGFVRERFFPESHSLIHPQAILFFLVSLIVYEVFTPAFSWPSGWDMLVGLGMFPVVFFSVYRLEEWLVSSSLLEFRGLRQSSK